MLFDLNGEWPYVGETMARPKSPKPTPAAGSSNEQKMPFPWWAKILFGAIGFIFVAGTTEVIRVESKVSSLDAHVQDLGHSLDRLSDKVDNLPQRLANALVSKALNYTKNQEYGAAAQVVETASTVINLALTDHFVARPEFFDQQIRILDEITALSPSEPSRLFSSIHDARVTLATYRSSLEVPL